MSQRPPADRGALAELIVPAAAVLFTAYYMWSVRDGPFEAKFSAYFVGSALLVVSGGFLVSRLWRLAQRGLPARAADNEPVPMSVIWRRLVLVALTLGYVLLIDSGGGFTLSSFVFLATGIVLLSGFSHVGRAVGVAATLSLTGYLVFIVAFDTRFPEGPVERLLAPLFG